MTAKIIREDEMRIIKEVFWVRAALVVFVIVLLVASYFNKLETVSGEVISVRHVDRTFSSATLIVVKDSVGGEYFFGWPEIYGGVEVGDNIEVSFRSDCFYEQKMKESVEGGRHTFDYEDKVCFDRVESYKKFSAKVNN